MRYVKEKMIESANNLKRLSESDLLLKPVSETADLIVRAVRAGNKLMICGNGGSAADAQHIAGEFVCRFYNNRKPMPAIALSTDTSVPTSISNDYSYDDVFSRQVTALGKKGDVLLGISTSGSSGNVLGAFRAAREMDIRTVLLTGEKEKKIAGLSDIVIKTPSSDTPRIQEMHLLIEHIICEIVEKRIYEGG
ncbi:MAG: D-sedoheptulose 7-phosphate isomerase [Nitrospirae bacterium]|nr:D-sedoheptulose 7-phosphate isomerase [Nitrospirota bacterium]